MKSMNLEDFLSSIEQIEKRKEDYVVPAKKLLMEDSDSLSFDGGGKFQLNEVSHGQLADRVGIPRKYYSRISEIEGLREYNVNELLRANPSRYTVRTVDNTARAVLSDRYLPVDNFLVLNQVMPVFKELPGVEIKTGNLTDRRMYMQVVFPHTQRDIVPGDAVQYGITLTNSEVGLGAINVESTIWRLVCSNGMIGKSIVNRRHAGRRITESDNMDLFRKETIKTDLKAFVMKLSDIIRYSLQEAQIEALIAPIRSAAGVQVEKPEETVEKITKKYDLRENEARNILRNMFEEKNLTKWGIVNGVTNSAKITDSPDRQYDLERIGNDIITLSPSEWEKVSA